jgi:hypothetical protein
MGDPIRGSPIVLIDTVTQIGTFPFAAHPTGRDVKRKSLGSETER